MGSEGAGGEAVVIGGSVAGLLAARALARHFPSVTILERDALTDTPEARKGVPQGRHAHVLVQGGQDALAALFAAGELDLPAAGALPADAARDLRWFQFGVWKKRFTSGLMTHWCDRPRFEQEVRRRVLAEAGIRLRTAQRVTGLITAGDGTGIAGVRVAPRDADEHELRADLVVDASGHSSRTAGWLEGLGYPRVREDVVEVDVGYASRIYRRPAQAGRDWTVLAIYPRAPHSRRAGVFYPLGGDRWLATLIGWVGDHPPADEDGFLDFARSLPQDELYLCLSNAEPCSPIRRHVFPASRWRRFEQMRRWPAGLIVVGDAVCQFNPVYGQGMTVGAMDAHALARALERAGHARAPAIAGRLQAGLARHRASPWLLATTSDFRFPEVRGRRPFGLAALNWYVQGVLELAADDRRAHLRFLEILGLRRSPTALFDPAVAWAVLRWGLRRRS